MFPRIYRNNDANVREYDEVLKFWSNGIGELCCPHGPVPYDITEAELPEELQRVYRDLYWEPNAGASLRYMVETQNGYGIALINEYDRVTAENSGLLMRPLFETVIQDAEEIAKDPLFEKAEVFAGEFMGFDGCHELVVVFTADIPVEEFCLAATRLDELTYQACGLGKGTAVDFLVKTANEKSARFVTDSVVSVGQFVESSDAQKALLESDKLRNQTLDVCYGIPGYEKLALTDKNQLYDLVKKAVMLSKEPDRDLPF